jgi:hypothetical protein
MAKSPNPSHVETIASVERGISTMANAPFIYFDNAPAYGLLNGIGQVTLEAGRIFWADAPSKVATDRVLVAHLRGSLPAIKRLRAALDGIILMAEPKAKAPAN